MQWKFGQHFEGGNILSSQALLHHHAWTLIQVWSIRQKKLLLDLPGHADEVFAVDWSPDGEKVASGGRDRVMKM